MQDNDNATVDNAASGNEGQTQPPAGDQGASQGQSGGEDKGVTQTQDNSEAGEGTKNPPPPGDSEDQDKEPPVRKTKIDYILERKNRQIEKLKQKTAQEGQKIDNKEDANASQTEDDDISPEEEAKIARVIEKRYGKKLETIDVLADNTEEVTIQTEIQTFLSSNEGKYFKEFESEIVRYAKHPNRSNIPIKSIAYEVAGPKLLEIGARMGEEARKEALTSKGSGGNTVKSSSSGKPDYDKMTPAEFETYKNEVKNRERD